MGIPMLRTCCCGCSLKTGAFLIAVLNIIIGMLDVISGISLLGVESEPTYKEHRHQISTAAVLLFIQAAVYIITGVLLCVGVIQDAPTPLLATVILTILTTAAFCIPGSLLAIVLIAQGDTASGVFTIIYTLIGAVIGLYYILVIYSLYRQVKEEPMDE